MKNSLLILRICAAVLLLVALQSIGLAQNRERFGISAKAGGVNAVSGRVMVKRIGQEPQLLTNNDELNAQDIVTTEAGSQTEILLNPGSYFRVAENSEFELSDDSLDNLRVKLNKGSAIVEATGFDDVALRINIATPETNFTITQRGVYRINTQPGSTELLVRKGRVLFGAAQQRVKGNNRITFYKDTVLITKLSKDKDDFDTWSKERAQMLARANQRLSTRILGDRLDSNLWASSISGRTFGGIWAYSSFSRCFTFIPFYLGWSSPYGLFYDRYLAVYGLSPQVGCCGNYTLNNSRNNNPSSGGWSGNSSSGGPSSGPSSGPSNPSPAPSNSFPQAPPRGAPRDPDSGGRLIRKLDP